MLKNKFGIENQIELARVEEKISKQKAIQLWQSGELKNFPAGSFQTLAHIHKKLFEDIDFFAGKIRDVNIAKGSFRFASALYLNEAVAIVEKMPQKNFDEIVEKYSTKKW